MWTVVQINLVFKKPTVIIRHKMSMCHNTLILTVSRCCVVCSSQGKQVPGWSDGLAHLHVPGVHGQRVGRHRHGRTSGSLPGAGRQPQVSDHRSSSGCADVTSDLGDSWRTEGVTGDLELSERSENGVTGDPELSDRSQNQVPGDL